MKEALWYKTVGNKVICELCPNYCSLAENEYGKCKVRVNHNNKLYIEGYGIISSVAIDPIEKKPLYHYYPGEKIFSIGTYGCNLHCVFCQNHSISQINIPKSKINIIVKPEELISLAIKNKTKAGIALTYNEPIVNYEYILEISKLAYENNIPVSLISNGYINKEPLKELMPYITAFNIDLKGFTDSFYSTYTKGKLNPVLNTLKQIKNANKYLEITHLLIPKLNDKLQDFKRLVEWISNNLGKETPFHLSRYFPNYELDIKPTKEHILLDYLDIAKQKLSYAYLGNMAADTSTYCSNCGALLIKRDYYNTKIVGLEANKCKKCKQIISIIR